MAFGGFGQARVVQIGMLAMLEGGAELIAKTERDTVCAVVTAEGIRITGR